MGEKKCTQKHACPLDHVKWKIFCGLGAHVQGPENIILYTLKKTMIKLSYVFSYAVHTQSYRWRHVYNSKYKFFNRKFTRVLSLYNLIPLSVMLTVIFSLCSLAPFFNCFACCWNKIINNFGNMDLHNHKTKLKCLSYSLQYS